MARTLAEITQTLSDEVDALSFASPVAYVYNPLSYARGPHEQYLQRFGQAKGRVVWMGMNPGPWGMAQTGVPFGEIAAVRDWMGIEGPVGQPPKVHPKRPVLGFEHPRSEVSGRRLWGWARDRYERPEDFFERFFVVNYCPLCFMEEGGKNRVPEKLPKEERAPLFEACDRALRAMIEELEPTMALGVGAFARKRAQKVLGGVPGLRFGQVLHPSPASPAANRGWAAAAEAQLEALGVL